MLSVLAVALAGGAVAVAAGWCLRRSDELGRPRPFPLVSMALLVALAVAGAVPGVLRAQQERRLGRAARLLGAAGALDERLADAPWLASMPAGSSARNLP